MTLCICGLLWARALDQSPVVQTLADLHQHLHYAALDIRPELMLAAVDEDGYLRLNLTDMFSGLFVDQPGEFSVLAAGMLTCMPYRHGAPDLHSWMVATMLATCADAPL